MTLATTADPRPDHDRDSGAVLLLVLAVSIVLSLVVLALANFVAADLRYAQVVDGQARRLASAQSGIDYALDRLRLNQTLCATDVAVSPVSLTGASSPGTPLPALANGTDTRITCKRLDGTIADVAGWAVVIADPLSGPSSRLRVDMTGTVQVGGPTLVRDPNRRSTDSNSILELVDGDLWYTGTPNCNTPKQSSDLGPGMIIGPAVARGPECTTRQWNDLFSAPLFTSMPTNVAGDTNGDGVVDLDSNGNGQVDGVLMGGCRVFSPGHYTMPPDFESTSNAYFQSGEYLFDFNGQWYIDGAQVWVGNPGPLLGSETVSNSACVNARDADINNGTGATFYFGGTNRLTVKDDGNVEMFARQQGVYMVSVQALPSSTTSSSSPLIRTEDFASLPTDLVVHGLVWAPNGWFTFDLGIPGSQQKLLGGIVVAGLLTPTVDPANFAIKPATSSVDTRILVTSTATLNGVSTTVEAVVAYRPQAASLDNRVAVTSYRVVD